MAAYVCVYVVRSALRCELQLTPRVHELVWVKQSENLDLEIREIGTALNIEILTVDRRKDSFTNGEIDQQILCDPLIYCSVKTNVK